MSGLELAETALSSYESAKTEQDRVLALSELRNRTFEAYRLIEADEATIESKQNELKVLEHTHLVKSRQRDSNSAKINELESFASSLGQDTEENGEQSTKSSIIIPLLHEYNIEASEYYATEKILAELEARKEAQSNTMRLRGEVDQLDMAVQRLDDFLTNKWPKIKEKYEETQQVAAKVETVYEEVIEEINSARLGEAIYAIKPSTKENNGGGGNNRNRNRKRGRNGNGNSGGSNGGGSEFTDGRSRKRRRA